MYDLYIYIAIVIIFFVLGLIIGYIYNPKRKLRKHKELPLSETAKNLGVITDTEKDIPREQRYPYREQKDFDFTNEQNDLYRERKDADKERKYYKDSYDFIKEPNDFGRKQDEFSREQYDIGKERNNSSREQYDVSKERNGFDRDRNNIDIDITAPEYEQSNSDSKNRSKNMRYGFSEYHKSSHMNYDDYRQNHHNHKTPRIL